MHWISSPEKALQLEMTENAGEAGSAAALMDKTTDEDTTELERDRTTVMVIETGTEEELLLCPTLEEEKILDEEPEVASVDETLELDFAGLQ